MHRKVLLDRNDLLQNGLRLFQPYVFRNQAQASRDTIDMRVHRQEREAEGKEENDGRRLRPDAWQGQKILHGRIVSHIAQKTEVDHTPKLLNLEKRLSYPPGLYICQAAGPDAVDHVFCGCIEEKLVISKRFLQIAEGPQAVCIAGVLGENGHDQQIHGVHYFRPGQAILLL
jgi:hypothetical protein